METKRTLTKIALFLSVFLTILFPQNASGNKIDNLIEVVERADDDILIFNLKIGRNVIFEGIPAYRIKEKFWVPFSDVISATELEIAVDIEAGLAKGWIIAKNRKFILDLKKKR